MTQDSEGPFQNLFDPVLRSRHRTERAALQVASLFPQHVALRPPRSRLAGAQGRGPRAHEQHGGLHPARAGAAPRRRRRDQGARGQVGRRALGGHRAAVLGSRRRLAARLHPDGPRRRRHGHEALQDAPRLQGQRRPLAHVWRFGPRAGRNDGPVRDEYLRLWLAVFLDGFFVQRAGPRLCRLPLRHCSEQGGPALPRSSAPRPPRVGGGRAHRQGGRASRRLPRPHRGRRRHGPRRPDGDDEADAVDGRGWRGRGAL
mmetsp:Transcript_26176/g.93400  ORF Transcript_26176/g.93400 Transcript_26176/m.93400 type:complete len:258 (+) Transcript_26176:166-939(+)